MENLTSTDSAAPAAMAESPKEPENIYDKSLKILDQLYGGKKVMWQRESPT